MASGEQITTHEFQTKPHRVQAPTLCLLIPDTSMSGSDSVPSFVLTVPSPVSPLSPILPVPSLFTRESYLAAAASAPSSSRVPSLPPQRCTHMLYLLSRSRCCSSCELQQLACEIWWGSRGAMLCAPQVPAAACTPTTRAVYYSLGLPLGRLEHACVDWDAATSISFMRQSHRVRKSSRSSIDTGIKSKPVVATRAPAPARILRVFVRRARHVLSAPTRVPMMSTHIVPRRRAIVRP
ncbi:hypothetical protein EI94DRAFT_1714222 [Lactarius quietus]|nr:hypothetical protein EI94DRAFT_1714222 [Lactarius quietus]